MTLSVRRIDAPEVARQRVQRDLAERARQLDAGRPRADDDEREPRSLLRRIGLALGGLVGENTRRRISSASSMS